MSLHTISVILSSKMPHGVALFSRGPPWTELRQKTRKIYKNAPDNELLRVRF
jgi:hypothetical protein